MARRPPTVTGTVCRTPAWRNRQQMLAALAQANPGAGTAAASVLRGTAKGGTAPTGHITAGPTPASPPGMAAVGAIPVPGAGGAGVGGRVPPGMGGTAPSGLPMMTPPGAAMTPSGSWNWLNRLLQAGDFAQKMAIVTSLGVQMTNTLDGFARIGIDVMTRALDNGMTRVGRLFNPALPMKPIDPFGEARYLFQHVVNRPIKGRSGTKAGEAVQLAENLENLAKLRNAQNRAAARGRNPINVTVPAVEPVMNRLAPRPVAAWERAASYLPYEFESPIRYSIFAAALDRELQSAMGMSLVQAHRLGRVPSNMSALVTKAIDKATHMTMGANPRDLKEFMGSFDRLAAKVLSLGSSGGLSGATVKAFTFLGAVFGRFLYNAVRFNLEYQPTGFLRLLTKENRAAIARGDMSVIGRELAGSAIFTLALATRSGLIPGLEPGSRWDLVKIGENPVSIMPFASIAPFFFLSDLFLRTENEYRESGLAPTPDSVKGIMAEMVRSIPHPANVARMLGLTDTPEAKRGRLPGTFSIGDVLEGILGQRPEAEAFTSAMQFMSDIAGIPATRSDPFESETPIQDAGAEIASRFTRLAAQFNAYVAEFKESAGLARETTGAFDRGALRGVPGISDDFPEKEVTTRGDTPRTSIPVKTPFGNVGSALLRQLMGVRIVEPSNVIEEELDNLGFTWRERNPATGNRAMNMLVRRYQGPLLEFMGGAIFSAETYQRLPSNIKIILARQMINGTRQIATDMAAGVAPGLRIQQMFERMPEDFRLMLGAALNDHAKTSGKIRSVADFAAMLKAIAEQDMQRQGL